MASRANRVVVAAGVPPVAEKDAARSGSAGSCTRAATVLRARAAAADGSVRDAGGGADCPCGLERCAFAAVVPSSPPPTQTPSATTVASTAKPPATPTVTGTWPRPAAATLPAPPPCPAAATAPAPASEPPATSQPTSAS